VFAKTQLTQVKSPVFMIESELLRH